VIVYADHRADKRTGAPPWLAGAQSLQERSGDPVRWHGVGVEAWLVGPQPDAVWHDLADGWQCCLIGPFNPAPLVRQQRWCDTEQAIDLAGRRWQAPVILADNGEPIYRVNYGRDFMPAPTSQQQDAERIARAARQELLSQGFIAGAHSRQWTARLLTITYHLDVEVIAVLGLLDDALILTTLEAATGLRLKKEVVS